MKIISLTHTKWKVPELIASRKEITKATLEAVIFLMLVAYTFYENVIAFIIFSPVIIFHIKAREREKEQRLKKELNKQFKDGMLAVSFALNVGYSIENSFKEALKEVTLLYGEEGRIVQEFRKIIYRINLNENIEDIIQDFANTSEVEDIIYFSEVFRYAKRSGGDLIAIIKNTARIITEKSEVKREIETVISGKKMEQLVMSMVPFGIIIYLKLTSPEFIEPLYGNIFGVTVMTICLALYIVSITIAKRIVNIEVA